MKPLPPLPRELEAILQGEDQDPFLAPKKFYSPKKLLPKVKEEGGLLTVSLKKGASIVTRHHLTREGIKETRRLMLAKLPKVMDIEKCVMQHKTVPELVASLPNDTPSTTELDSLKPLLPSRFDVRVNSDIHLVLEKVLQGIKQDRYGYHPILDADCHRKSHSFRAGTRRNLQPPGSGQPGVRSTDQVLS